MPHVVKLEQFEGPLDLLLRLAESEKFDLTTVSLGSVCDDYLATIRVSRINPEEAADFLVVASKLLLLKASNLMPGVAADAEVREASALADQLNLLAAYVAASRDVYVRYRSDVRTYARERSPILRPMFCPPARTTAEHVMAAFRALIGAITPLVNIPQAVVRRVLSLERKLNELRERLGTAARVYFSDFIHQARDRQELIVSFLALLELVKQRTVVFEQAEPFGEIIITRNAT